MVEFGFVFTLFLLLVVGLFEFGRAVWTYQTLGYATRHGVRVAMIGGSTVTAAEIESAIEQNAPGLNGGYLDVNVVWADAAMERGTLVQVEATYPFQFVVSALWGGNSSLSFSSTAQRVIAQ